MSEPAPEYNITTASPGINAGETAPYSPSLRGESKYARIRSEDLDVFERRLINLLKMVWKLQGKQRKIIRLD